MQLVSMSNGKEIYHMHTFSLTHTNQVLWCQ